MSGAMASRGLQEDASASGTPTEQGALQPARAEAFKQQARASPTSLSDKTINGLLPQLNPKEVVHNISRATEACAGGQGQVFMCEWQNLEGGTSVIADGTPVAIKHCRNFCGGRNYGPITTKQEFDQDNERGQDALRIELHRLTLLHDGGCGARVVQPLGCVGWQGEWTDDPWERESGRKDPLYAHVMPWYRRGSLLDQLTRICYASRLDPVTERLMSHSFLAGEYCTLLRELRKMHTGLELMLQDLTPSNLLVDDSQPEGPRLLFADTALAMSTETLRSRPSKVLGTQQWGSMRARNKQFDPKADLYSLSFAFAEMWLAAENVPPLPYISAGERPPICKTVTLLRCTIRHLLCQHYHGSALDPRCARPLPVSWLGAWVLLLGCRDHPSVRKEHERAWLAHPCLRPEEEQMLPLAELWQRVAEAAEALPEQLTAEQASSAEHSALVRDMCDLFSQLKALSHLDDAGDQQDADLAWLAANFTAQPHPLVQAMAAQGAAGVGTPEPRRPRYFRDCGWAEAKQDAMDRIRALEESRVVPPPPLPAPAAPRPAPAPQVTSPRPACAATQAAAAPAVAAACGTAPAACGTTPAVGGTAPAAFNTAPAVGGAAPSPAAAPPAVAAACGTAPAVCGAAPSPRKRKGAPAAAEEQASGQATVLPQANSEAGAHSNGSTQLHADDLGGQLGAAAAAAAGAAGTEGHAAVASPLKRHRQRAGGMGAGSAASSLSELDGERATHHEPAAPCAGSLAHAAAAAAIARFDLAGLAAAPAAPASSSFPLTAPWNWPVKRSVKYAEKVGPFAFAMLEMICDPDSRDPRFAALDTEDKQKTFLQWWAGTAADSDVRDLRACLQLNNQTKSEFAQAVAARVEPDKPRGRGSRGWIHKSAMTALAAGTVLGWKGWEQPGPGWTGAWAGGK